jgi:hypothetical protein
MSWADAHGVGHLAWTWDTRGCDGGQALTSDYTGTACDPYGLTYWTRSWTRTWTRTCPLGLGVNRAALQTVTSRRPRPTDGGPGHARRSGRRSPL